MHRNLGCDFSRRAGGMRQRRQASHLFDHQGKTDITELPDPPGRRVPDTVTQIRSPATARRNQKAMGRSGVDGIAGAAAPSLFHLKPHRAAELTYCWRRKFAMVQQPRIHPGAIPRHLVSPAMRASPSEDGSRHHPPSVGSHATRWAAAVLLADTSASIGDLVGGAPRGGSRTTRRREEEARTISASRGGALPGSAICQ